MTLTRWTPTRDLAAIEIERLNRMFDSVFGGEALERGAWNPAVDVYETPDQGVVFKAELPDMKREEIKVTVENNVLAIEGDRKFSTETKREQYHRIERNYGAFRRSFTLPSTVDASHVQAAYTDGILTITVPHRPEAKPRQITVEG
jgi:HSP20 family protein